MLRDCVGDRLDEVPSDEEGLQDYSRETVERFEDGASETAFWGITTVSNCSRKLFSANCSLIRSIENCDSRCLFYQYLRWILRFGRISSANLKNKCKLVEKFVWGYFNITFSICQLMKASQKKDILLKIIQASTSDVDWNHNQNYNKNQTIWKRGWNTKTEKKLVLVSIILLCSNFIEP